MGKSFKNLALAALLSACAHHQMVNDSSNVATEKGVVSAWAEWVKVKGKKLDINFSLKNEAMDKFIIVMLHDMACSKGGHTGKLEYTFFNTGERTIDLAPGQTKNANMVCTLPASEKGDITISIARVYDNPSKDRATSGKVIAENVVWTMKEQK